MTFLKKKDEPETNNVYSFYLNFDIESKRKIRECYMHVFGYTNHDTALRTIKKTTAMFRVEEQKKAVFNIIEEIVLSKKITEKLKEFKIIKGNTLSFFDVFPL